MNLGTHKERWVSTSRIWIAGWCSLAIAACGDFGGGKGEPGEPVPLWVSNQSQFPLMELYVHEEGNADIATNELQTTLEVGQGVMVDILNNQTQHVSVVRPKRLTIGTEETIVVSTADPVDVPADGYSLWVFDASFRLVKP